MAPPVALARVVRVVDLVQIVDAVVGVLLELAVQLVRVDQLVAIGLSEVPGIGAEAPLP